MATENDENAGLTTGVRPSGFAAACLSLASEQTRGFTQRAVANAANTTPATIRKHRDTLLDQVA